MTTTTSKNASKNNVAPAPAPAPAVLTVQQQIDAAVAAALAAQAAAKPKVRPRDKMYVAGMCVAKFGYTDPIDNNMIDYVNTEYGIANNATSLACIKAARAAVAAYVAETTPAAGK